jgi:hypothetical protein
MLLCPIYMVGQCFNIYKQEITNNNNVITTSYIDLYLHKIDNVYYFTKTKNKENKIKCKETLLFENRYIYFLCCNNNYKIKYYYR